MGTAVIGAAAVVAWPFVRRWRFAKFGGTIDTDSNNTGLSATEIEKVCRVFQKERDMWDTFRGVAGNIRIVKEIAFADGRPPLVVADEGHIALSFDVQPVEGKETTSALTNVKMAFSKAPNADPVWSLSVAGTGRDRTGSFTGTEIESVRHGHLYDLLTLPASVLLRCHTGLMEFFCGWKVSRNPSIPGPDSFTIETAGIFTADGLVPIISFSHGHISQFIPQRLPGEPFSVFSFKDQVVDNGIAYPRILSMVTSDPDAVLPERESVTVTFSDIRVAAA